IPEGVEKGFYQYFPQSIISRPQSVAGNKDDIVTSLCLSLSWLPLDDIQVKDPVFFSHFHLTSLALSKTSHVLAALTTIYQDSYSPFLDFL
ncbi:unnamed protein product, partial [marine sediment metagenome]